MPGPTRILFFAESVTLAHLARPLALAGGLDPAKYDITIACDSRYQGILAQQPFATAPLHSLPSAQFLKALARGSPVYGLNTLEGYVQEDLALMDALRPDIVVGDFRLSLSVSARLARIPYATITNAYWSPYSTPSYPVPVLPFVRWTGARLGTALFRLARPLAFALHSGPLNALRRHHGLSSLGWDLRRVYTDADLVLYADVPELIPTRALPSNHHYLGPILWAPTPPLPRWWDSLSASYPIVYLTLGSSGANEMLPEIIRAWGNHPLTLMVASAGHPPPAHLPPNVHWADYLPGIQAAERADLVICNGGSPTSHQALAAGVPVLGIASNLDQFLNMQAIAAAGAGILMRQDTFKAGAFMANVQALLEQPGYRTAAGQAAGWFKEYSAALLFPKLMQDIASA